MSTLALFAETPRAGDLGHRFLVTGKDQSPERQIAQYLKSVDKDISFGANFIGLARSVQQHSGTAVRTGREIIVLAGVDVSRLPGPSRDRLLALLQEHLDRLGQLVLRGIDWSRLPHAELVVRSGELSQWLDEIRALGLPKTEWLGGPRALAPADAGPTSTRRVRISRAVVGYVLAVALLLVVVAWFFGTPQSGADRSAAHQELEGHGQGSKAAESEHAISELADQWDCSSDDVVRSLLRAANWDRRREEDTLSLDTGLSDEEVRLLLDKVTSKTKTGVERLLVSPAIDQKSGFKEFAAPNPLSPVKSSFRVRRWLYNALEKWNGFRDSVSKATKGLEDLKDTNALAKMMLVSHLLQPDEGLGDGFLEPATPLFDRQDVMIWRFLDQCRSTLQDNGINAYLKERETSAPASDLASFLAAVRVYRQKIVAELARNRSDVAVTVLKARGEEDEKAVIAAYDAFGQFLEHLARFDDR